MAIELRAARGVERVRILDIDGNEGPELLLDLTDKRLMKDGKMLTAALEDFEKIQSRVDEMSDKEATRELWRVYSYVYGAILGKAQREKLFEFLAGGCEPEECLMVLTGPLFDLIEIVGRALAVSQRAQALEKYGLANA